MEVIRFLYMEAFESNKKLHLFASFLCCLIKLVLAKFLLLEVFTDANFSGSKSGSELSSLAEFYVTQKMMPLEVEGTRNLQSPRRRRRRDSVGEDFRSIFE